MYLEATIRSSTIMIWAILISVTSILKLLPIPIDVLMHIARMDVYKYEISIRKSRNKPPGHRCHTINANAACVINLGLLKTYFSRLGGTLHLVFEGVRESHI